MAEQKKLTDIAKTSPGLATAMAQSNLPKDQVSAISAMVELRNLHNNLTQLPQNQAYKKYQALPDATQNALSSMFNPKYMKEDKGVFGNIFDSVKSAVWYGGGTAFDVVKQVLGVAQNPLGTVAKAGVAAGVSGVQELGKTPAGQPVAKGVSAVAEVLTRPQEKLIKQPYMAQRLAETAGEGTWGTYGQFLLEGAKELLPGGRDAVVTDNSTNFLRYWEQASDPTKVFDEAEVASFSQDLSPSASYVGRLLASKSDLVGSYEDYKDNAGVIDLVNRYVSGDVAAGKEVADAVARYEKAKISPGRDVARFVVEILPYEAERAAKGDGAAKALFNAISAPIDFGVTFGLDPLILGGKAKRAVDVAKLGLFKMGADPVNLSKAFQRGDVKQYWDNIGSLVEEYSKGDLTVQAQVLNRVNTRYREISTDVFNTLVEYKVTDSAKALDYLTNQQNIVEMLAGRAGVAGKDSLIPRYTPVRAVSDTVKDFANKVMKTGDVRQVRVPDNIDDFAKQFNESPTIWAEKLGVERGTGGVFTPRDKSAAARIDRVARQFAIAPMPQRLISITDASSADDVFKLVRSVTDPTSAGAFRAAWIGANEGQRLLMLRGVLKTMGRGMGLDQSEEGLKLLSAIDDMSTELYSVNQTAINLGELTSKLRVVRAEGVATPQGVRKLVQEATNTATAEGKAGRLAASLRADINKYTDEINILEEAKRQATAAGLDLEDIALIDERLKLVKAIRGSAYKGIKDINKKIKGTAEEVDDLGLRSFNAAEIDGTQRAIRQYQLSTARALPDFNEWRAVAARAGVLSDVFGRATSNAAARNLTDAWSFGNLYPRLGIRTTVEEVGTFGIISGAEGFGNYLKARLVSRELRAATPSGTKTRILKKRSGELKEVEVRNLGIVYDNLYKITKKHYSDEKLLEMSNDPELLGQAVADSVLKNRFRPSFLKTKEGREVSEYARDFARFDGKTVLDDINGASYRAEKPISEVDQLEKTLEAYGPSVALNVQLREALKGMTFKKEFSEISYKDEKFLLNWFLEINNVVGKRNGQFGNIVLWNAGKKEEDVIAKLVDYIEGDGNDIAKRFAIYNQEGAEGLAVRMYADITYPLRDYSGRLNMELINGIRNAGGIDKFTLDDLVKYDKEFARPEQILGKEIIPISGKDAGQMVNRIINNGYGWVGKQIALLDREPITLANYIMFRKEVKGVENALRNKLVESGLTEEGADAIARFSAHETSLNLARNRTLGFADNSDVRTNLAVSLRTFGRYYRATEDFYRRVLRLAKFEKRALVRLAILNQTFEDSGVIHRDDNGDLYFTYPGDDILNAALSTTLNRVFGINSFQPLPVNFGGKVKMLTPSLDPESAAPRLGGPLTSVLVAAFEQLPFVGSYIKENEKLITGGFNTEAPFYKKILPVNMQRAFDLAFDDKNQESRMSSIIKSMRLLVSTGHGPTSADEIDQFLYNTTIQAKNADATRFWMGFTTPASVQMFATKDIPKELINAGVFSWDSEYQKFLKKYDGDPRAMQKALVEFARLYPSKLVYTVSATQTDVEANFRKSLDAANFVKDNKSLFSEFREGASFFIPVSGSSDYESYMYLKNNGFVENKNLEAYTRQVATAAARQAYFALKDEYEQKRAATGNPNTKRKYTQDWESIRDGMYAAYPLLAGEVNGDSDSKIRKQEALSSLERLIASGKAPDKKLAETFTAMISVFRNHQAYVESIPGSSRMGSAAKKNSREDTRDILVKLSQDNAQASALYYTIFDSLIGE